MRIGIQLLPRQALVWPSRAVPQGAGVYLPSSMVSGFAEFGGEKMLASAVASGPAEFDGDTCILKGPFPGGLAWGWAVTHSMEYIPYALKNSVSHIDASLSRQPLVKGERLVRYEVNAVML